MENWFHYNIINSFANIPDTILLDRLYCINIVYLSIIWKYYFGTSFFIKVALFSNFISRTLNIKWLQI